MKKLSKINESVFKNVIGRSEGKDDRIEDYSILKNKVDDFISTNGRNGYKYQIKNGLVNFYCGVDVVDGDLIDGKFPFKFGDVSGYFNCSHCEDLVSLEGAPQKVGGNFFCKNCYSLTSLEGAPQEVGDLFYCSYCRNITSLKGSPNNVGGSFVCRFCDALNSLDGAPQKVGRDFVCSSCISLESLKDCTLKSCNDFYCNNCGKKFEESDLPKNIIIKGHFYN